MPPPDLRNALGHLCRAAGLPPDTGLSDRQLLDRFAAAGDEAAFAALVRRHGGLVLGACRRMLHNAADAEDAFQATFLVLARKPQAVRSRGSVGPWLFGVALRVAARLKADARRRRDRERAAASRPAPVAPDPTLREVEAVLDEELSRLPTRLRSPLVLCYLEARTRDEAARELGWSVRTLRRRLEEGRRRLHLRLVRRGVSLPAALLTAGLVQPEASAALPRAVAAARAFAAGGAGVPARVAAAAQAALRGMFLTRLSALAALTLALGTAGAGALALHRPTETAAQAPADESGPGPEVAAERSGPAQLPGRDAFGDPLPPGAIARIGTVRFSHGQDLRTLLFTPDGKTIVSVGSVNIRLWDAATGEERGHFATGDDLRDELTALTPDGKALVSLNQESTSDTLRVHDLALQKEVRRVPLPMKRWESSVDRRNALSPDCGRCLTHTPEDIRVFDTTTAGQLCKLPKNGREVRAAVFAGNDRVVTADADHNIEVWEAATGNLVRRFAHGSPAEVLTASADGRHLATLEHHTHAIDRFLDKDVVHVWDLNAGVREHVLAAGRQGWYMRVRFSPDGKLLLATSVGKGGYEVAVWDVATGRRLRTLDAPGLSLAVSPDGGRLAEGAPQGKFEVWDLRTGRRLSSGPGPHARAPALHLSATGDRAVTVGYHAVTEWDAATGRRLRSFDLPRSDNRYLRDISPDGRYALSSEGEFADARAVVHEVGTGRRLYDFPAGASVVFSPDSSLLASADGGKDGSVCVRDARSGREVRTLRETTAGWPARLSFAADGKRLFVVGRQVTGYEAATGKELFSWRLPPLPNDTGAAAAGAAVLDYCWWRAHAVSPGGTLAAFNTQAEHPGVYPGLDRLVLCDASTGRVYRRWRDSEQVTQGTEAMLFSPDGRLLASTDRETVHLWEVATAREVRTFSGHRGGIESLSFSADGRRLASSGHDCTTLVWGLTPAPVRDAGEKEVVAWWADLAGKDAARASDAAWHLAAAPGPAVALLRRHLRPITADSLKTARDRIAELDSESFAVREKASAELERFGPAAVPLLEQALREGPAPEAKRRLTQLLEKVDPLPASGEPLRAWRALAVLERAATPETRRLLAELAGGEPEVWLTREANAALLRLGKRGGAIP